MHGESFCGGVEGLIHRRAHEHLALANRLTLCDARLITHIRPGTIAK